MAEISIEIQTTSDVPVVRLTGELDIDQAVRVREHLDKVIDAGAVRLVIDLSDVSYIDSTGLGMLVAVHKRLVAEQGFYVLTVPRASQRKVFEITGLSTVLVIMESLEDALAHISAKAKFGFRSYGYEQYGTCRVDVRPRCCDACIYRCRRL